MSCDGNFLSLGHWLIRGAGKQRRVKGRAHSSCGLLLRCSYHSKLILRVVDVWRGSITRYLAGRGPLASKSQPLRLEVAELGSGSGGHLKAIYPGFC